MDTLAQRDLSETLNVKDSFPKHLYGSKMKSVVILVEGATARAVDVMHAAVQTRLDWKTHNISLVQ